jgi:hypothetical protein
MPDQQKNENAKVINIDVSMLHLPSPSLQSVYRANFDACADNIPTFLLFQ